jgi:hypothetical protein
MDQDAKHRPDADAVGWTQDEFSEDLGHGRLPGPRTAGHHEPVAGDLTKEERERLTILAEGTPLDGGSTYLDLDDPGAGPFTAKDGQTAEPGRRLVSKRDTDYELWNRLVGRQTGAG